MGAIKTSVVLINVITPKAGKIDEVVAYQANAQRQYAGAVDGLIGTRLHRALDGKNVVVTTIFESVEHHRRWIEDKTFLGHVNGLKPLIERAEPGYYEIVAESGRIQD